MEIGEFELALRLVVGQATNNGEGQLKLFTVVAIMRMFKIIRLIWTFYKNFLLLSAIITAFCIRAFWMYDLAGFFGIFWCKVVTLGLTYYFINTNKKNEYYYYQNLGVPKALLWMATLSFDFIMFLVLIILTYHLK